MARLVAPRCIAGLLRPKHACTHRELISQLPARPCPCSCPSDLPICDLEQQSCRSDVDPSGRYLSSPMKPRTKAQRRFMRSKLFGLF